MSEYELYMQYQIMVRDMAIDQDWTKSISNNTAKSEQQLVIIDGSSIKPG